MSLLTFKKTSKQVEAINALAASRYCALYGGSRSGKTFGIIYALIVRMCKEKSRHAVFRKTFNSLKRSMVMDTFPKVMNLCFPDLSYHINKTDWFVKLPNGSELWFCGLDSGDRIEKVLGMEFSTLYFNEASEIDYSSIQLVMSRLAERNGLTKRVWFDFNPPSKAHFSYWLFIKKINPVDSEPLKNPENYTHLLMNPKDNLENIDEEYLAILEAMPEKERARFLEGQFADDSDGQAYYEFDRERHVSTSAVRQQGTVHTGMDFNVNPFTGTFCSIVNNEIHVFDEMFLENSDTPKASKYMRAKNLIGTIYPDSTGKNRKTSGKTDHQILRDDGHKIVFVNNPLQYDRVNNINRLLKDNRIKINPKCKKLINDLEKVTWKNGKLDEGTEKMLTHISDAIGYLAWNLFPFSEALRVKVGSQRR